MHFSTVGKHSIKSLTPKSMEEEEKPKTKTKEESRKKIRPLYPKIFLKVMALVRKRRIFFPQVFILRHF